MEGEKSYSLQGIINRRNAEDDKSWDKYLEPYTSFLSPDLTYMERRLLAGNIALFMRTTKSDMSRWPKSSRENLLSVIDKVDQVNQALRDDTISPLAPWIMELATKMLVVNEFVDKIKSIVDVEDMRRKRAEKIEEGKETARGDELLDEQNSYSK